MPMGSKLAPAEIALIRAWIEQGADWPGQVGKHWAFVPPVRPPSPAVRDARWPAHPIDRFTLVSAEHRRTMDVRFEGQFGFLGTANSISTMR
jgi:hypothetical protein